jgi:hypothetical protein
VHHRYCCNVIVASLIAMSLIGSGSGVAVVTKEEKTLVPPTCMLSYIVLIVVVSLNGPGDTALPEQTAAPHVSDRYRFQCAVQPPIVLILGFLNSALQLKH